MKIRCFSVFSPCACVVIGDADGGAALRDWVEVVVLAVVHAMASTSTPINTRRRGERIGRGVYRRPTASEGGVGLLLFPRPRIQDQRRVGRLAEVERVRQWVRRVLTNRRSAVGPV